MNSLPRPLPSLAAVTVPPCIFTSRRTSARPMPRPLCGWSDLLSTCVNRSKIRGSSSAGMPMPLSRTRISTSSPARRTVRRMCPPRLVYLAALPSTLPSACVRRSGSPLTLSGSSGVSTVNWWPRASISGCTVSTARATRVATSTGLARQSDLAARDARHIEQIVDQARQVRQLPLDHVARPDQLRVADRSMRMSCTALRIGASGLRSSCASIARNSSLWRSASFSACSARARSTTSLCSARLALRQLRVGPLQRGVQLLELAGLLRLQRRVGLRQALVGLRQIAVQLAQLAALAVQLDQHRDLAAQDLRHHRDGDVVDRAELVALAGGRARSRARR